MQLSDLDFFLPETLIAQRPAYSRDASKMLVVDKRSGILKDSDFSHFVDHVLPGDVLVLNNTKVFPARILGRTETGALIEIFLVEQNTDGTWNTLAKPARRLSPGKKIIFSDELTAETIGRTESGGVNIRFDLTGDIFDVLDRVGQTPLPPYIKRPEGSTSEDSKRYQTVYASERGAIAAPTAGLHFTPAILDALADKGTEIVELTLHVGYGTFEPVRAAVLADHKVAPETYKLSENAAEMLNKARSEGRRIIAAGTTSTRALEDNISKDDRFKPGDHRAELTITPGHEFKAINGLLTNFHLPKSSLLLLTSTFGGFKTIMEAYEHAVKNQYRFYSYGDCMLIL